MAEAAGGLEEVLDRLVVMPLADGGDIREGSRTHWVLVLSK